MAWGSTFDPRKGKWRFATWPRTDPEDVYQEQVRDTKHRVKVQLTCSWIQQRTSTALPAAPRQYVHCYPDDETFMLSGWFHLFSITLTWDSKRCSRLFLNTFVLWELQSTKNTHNNDRLEPWIVKNTWISYYHLKELKPVRSRRCICIWPWGVFWCRTERCFSVGASNQTAWLNPDKPPLHQGLTAHVCERTVI